MASVLGYNKKDKVKRKMRQKNHLMKEDDSYLLGYTDTLLKSRVAKKKKNYLSYGDLKV